MTSTSNIKNQVIDLCESVSHFIKKESIHFDQSKIEQKEGFSNLVSYVDKESEKRLVDGLLKIIPEAGCLGEEGASIESSSPYKWVIDPLDGTTNFLHGFPMYSISIGLMRDNKVILGVVLDITRDECFHAAEGEHAYCNKTKIHVAATSRLSEGLIATGFPYIHASYMETYIKIIQEFIQCTHGIRRLGSAALDLAYVACGRLDGFFEYDLHPWDVAGGSFIVQQAGGVVTDFSGEDNFINCSELCAAGGIHGAMLEVIQNLWTKQ